MTIFAGNVVTPEMTEQLLLSGADVVKVGIGPGSVCTTRKQTGVGYPQLSAVLECAEAAHGLGGHVISDGGCTCPGDFSKAFGAGADFIMSGGMFAVLRNIIIIIIIIYVSYMCVSSHEYMELFFQCVKNKLKIVN
jgi:IMP dehydrogenase/GMP reductase